MGQKKTPATDIDPGVSKVVALKLPQRPHQALNYKTPAGVYFGRELEISRTDPYWTQTKEGEGRCSLTSIKNVS